MQDNLIEAFNIGIDAATDAEMIAFVNGFEHHFKKQCCQLCEILCDYIHIQTLSFQHWQHYQYLY